MAGIFLLSLSLVIWLFLLFFWGDFWLANQYVNLNCSPLNFYPVISIIVPARNEAEVIERSLESLLNQEYPGYFSVVLVNDNSSDNTANIARLTADKLNKVEKLNIVDGNPLESGWKGKLWAINQGIEYAKNQTLIPDYFLLTDADISHHQDNLSQLVCKAKTENLDLVSLMVLLRCESLWEKLLIPAFVFFFQKLYPFDWVNDAQKNIAAAAGGCILISSKSLEEIGGIQAIKEALIDDCSLAKAIKSNNNKIWLGLTKDTVSLRPYDNLKTIWDTIARTAFTQLNYSWLLLIGTLMGMSLVYLTAPIGLAWGILMHCWQLIVLATIVWLLMAIAFMPTLKLYKLSLVWSLSLPAIALLYSLMTIDSAIKYYQGKGGAWKGRTY